MTNAVNTYVSPEAIIIRYIIEEKMATSGTGDDWIIIDDWMRDDDDYDGFLYY